MTSNDSYVVRVKRGTANDWALYNPILGTGELGYDITNRRLKVGDGLNVWSNLKFATGNSYDIAKDAGFDGSLSQWVESLKGKPGKDGDDGKPGPAVNLTVGSVKVADTAAVRVKGTSPSQQLEFDLPRSTEPSTVPGPPNQLAIGTVSATTGNPTATVTGNYPNQKLNLTLKTGANGVKGDMSSLTIGTVDESDVSAQADVVKVNEGIYALNLTLRRGAKGDKGDTPTLSVGPTTTGDEGTNANVTIDGTELKFTIPRGPKGDKGTVDNVSSEDITDATATGKSLITTTSAATARTALGLSTGATSATGSAAELTTGTSTTARVWTPKILADWLISKLPGVATTAINGLMSKEDKAKLDNSSSSGASTSGLVERDGSGSSGLVNLWLGGAITNESHATTKEYVDNLQPKNTGWRNISSSFVTTFGTVTAKIRRKDDTVTLVYDLTANTTTEAGNAHYLIKATGSPLLTIGVPTGPVRFLTPHNSAATGADKTGVPNYLGIVGNDGAGKGDVTEFANVTAAGLGAPSGLFTGHREVSWVTKTAWPTTLPGTPTTL